MFDLILGVLAIFGFSIVGALNRKTGTFSPCIFLAGVVIGIGIMIWIGIIPFYSVIVSVICIIGMFFMGHGESDE